MSKIFCTFAAETAKDNDGMKRLFYILAVGMMLGLVSCEGMSEKEKVKGLWVTGDGLEVMGEYMEIEYNELTVEYRHYVERFNASAVYKGSYTIKDSVITHAYKSRTVKNGDSVDFVSLKKIPREAVLQQPNTIVYLDCCFTRQ